MMNYGFLRQRSIDKLIADFFCKDLKLIIEVDGYTHQFEQVYDKDKLKDRTLNALGYTVLRFTDNESNEGYIQCKKSYRRLDIQ